MNGIKTWLFSKSSSQVESIHFTHQTFYNGTFKYSSYPLSYITKCSYDGISLLIKGHKLNEEFMMKDAGLAVRIQSHMVKGKKQGKKSIEEIVKQVRAGVYFVVYEVQDEEYSNQSKRSINNLNGKQNKMLWTDCLYLYINHSKTKNMSKVPLNTIKKVILEELSESSGYKVMIIIKDANHISLYSNDFFKTHKVVIALEYLCINSENSHYIGRPQSGVGLLFKKALSVLKAIKESNYSTYKRLFIDLRENYKETTELEVISEECNDLNDTKELPSQVSSNINPQELVRGNKGKLKRQLSIYKEQESDSEDKRNRSYSVLGLFQAKLSPIKTSIRMKKSMSKIITPKTKFVQSCCGDYVEDIVENKGNINESSYIKVVDESSKLFTDHSFSIERCTEIPLPLVREDSGEQETPMETARFIRPQYVSASSRTEPEFGHTLKINESVLSKYETLKEKTREYKSIIQEQNIKLERLVGKYELQEEKMLTLEVTYIFIM